MFNSTKFISSPVRSINPSEYVSSHCLLVHRLMQGCQIWDLRTGSISDTIRYEHPITALQFDSRKIIAAAGENAVRVSPPSWL